MVGLRRDTVTRSKLGMSSKGVKPEIGAETPCKRRGEPWCRQHMVMGKSA